MSEENLPEFIDLATSLLQKGEFEELITKFENLNISDPHIVYIHSLLGIAYYKKGFLIEAKKRFELSMDMDVKSLSKEIIIAVKKNYGLFLLENENYPEAQSIYKEIIKLEPDDLIAHLNSGEVFFHMAKLDDSIKELEIASNLDPENVETKTKLEKVNDFKNDIYGAQSTEDIINDEFIESYKEYFSDIETLEEHAENIATLRARLGESFIEGYGTPLVNHKIPFGAEKNSIERAININVLSEDDDCDVEVEEI